MKFIIFLITIVLYINNGCCKVNSLTDDELIDRIRNDERLIVLFTKVDCDECDKYESMIDNLSHDFKEHMNAEAVKAINSPMAALFSPSKEPAIVYYRRGLPLLYHGPLSEEAIVNNFYENPEPVVKELSDENFEHLTQAATGATTGDWFILFYTTDCISCQRLHASWEAVGAALKNRANIARINIQNKGKITGKRFEIDSTPEFIFFRLGKMYRYRSKSYAPDAFITFATSDYKETRAEDVPPEYSEPFYSALLELAVVRDIVIVLAAIGFIGAILFLLKRRSATKKEATKKAK